MKTIFKRISIVVFVSCISCISLLDAQNVYVLGQYYKYNRRVSAVYLNGHKLYNTPLSEMHANPQVLVCDSEENVYWLVTRSLAETSFDEIYKNNQLYISTENLDGIGITDIYCLHDTLFYTGYLTENDVEVAMVWYGSDFTPYRVLGDGVFSSRITDADVDKTTDIPYYSGYVVDTASYMIYDKHSARVWKDSEVYYTLPLTYSLGYLNGAPYYDTITWSEYNCIAVDDGMVCCTGEIECGGWDSPFVWVDNAPVAHGQDWEKFWGPCVTNGRYCCCHLDADWECGTYGIYYDLYDYGHGYVSNIRAANDEIYIAGRIEVDDNYIAMVWKDGEVIQEIQGCEYAIDVFPVTNTLDVYETNPAGDFQIFPNPTQDLLHVVKTVDSSSQQEQTEYSITNLLGQTLLKGSLEGDVIDVSSLSNGVYFLILNDRARKIVVNR